MGIVAWRRDHPPVEPAHPQRVAIAKSIVVTEPLGALIGDRKDERLLVPAVDERRLAIRDAGSAAVFLLDRCVAAHVVGVAVRIDEPRKRLSMQSMLEQR